MRKFLFFILMVCFETTMSRAGPIHDAAKTGDVAAIMAALNAGTDVNAIDGIPLVDKDTVESGGQSDVFHIAVDQHLQ